MKAIKKFFFQLGKFFQGAPTLKCGSSMNFLGKDYARGEIVPLNIGDEVIIHPVPGHSQATIDYPAKIVTMKVKGRDGKTEGLFWVLCVVGIKGNKHSGWINDYLFGRLEFVSRNYKGE